MPHKGQPWTPWEIMMISEWVERTFGDVKYQTHVRLGKIQPRLPDGTYTEDETKMLGLWRRYADAIVFLPDRLLLVESVMTAHPGKLQLLKLYEMLIPQTPELEEVKELPIQKVLLFAIEDPMLTELAKREGILPIHYVPTFFEKWFSGLKARHQRAPRSTL